MRNIAWIVLICAPLAAADLTGNWLATFSGPDGNTRKTYYDLKQQGATITGFLRSSAFDRPVEGTVDEAGNFTITAEIMPGRPPMKTTGRLEPDGLHVAMRMGPNQPPREVIALKVPAGEGGPPPRIPPPALHKVKSNGLGKTPPMGWNSWNHFAGRVTAEDVKGMADALVNSGMKDAGYIYVNIDDTWMAGRDAQGNILTNKKFPDMKALADYVHGKGLKIGIYSSPGPSPAPVMKAATGMNRRTPKPTLRGASTS